MVFQQGKNNSILQCMAKRLEFHFKGGSADNHQLPVDLMINLLTNIKDLTYLIAAQEQGFQFNERLRPSKQIKDNYLIKCELPQKGSYSQAISLEYIGQENMFQTAEKSFEIVENTLWFVMDMDEPKIIHTFPNAKVRSKVLSHLKQAMPPLNSDFYLEVTNTNRAVNSRVMQKNITSIIDKTQAIVEGYMTVVTGRLMRIDFAEKKIVIIHPLTGRALDCFYNEDIEDMLLDNRRQLVQITGMVEFDENDHPKKITDSVSIQDIDLAPIEFDYIDYGDKKLRFKNRLVLTPELDDSEQLYTISYPDFNLESFAYTRQEITDEIKSDIVFLWNEYAKAEDSELTEDALELKKRLLLNIEDIANV
jgi:hypothetical protein